jgi:L-threonylcarbamoyladenylate synthase
MTTLKVDPARPASSAVFKAAEAVKGGKVIVYPTDTVYGIGCRIQEEPVRRVFAIKGRDFNSPLSVAFSSIEEAGLWTHMSKEQRETVAAKHRDGTTFILRKRGIPDYVTAGLPTVGVRIPDSLFCIQLIRETGPIITTSANPTGQPAPASFDEIDDKILSAADLAVDGGRCKYAKPSKIIDLTNQAVLRD